jgi:cbb3-type cytochrome oxidase maturation protein
MSVIVLLLLASVCIAGGFLVAFLWSIKDGQLDDDFAPPLRMLYDDKPTINP